MGILLSCSSVTEKDGCHGVSLCYDVSLWYVLTHVMVSACVMVLVCDMSLLSWVLDFKLSIIKALIKNQNTEYKPPNAKYQKIPQKVFRTKRAEHHTADAGKV